FTTLCHAVSRSYKIRFPLALPITNANPITSDLLRWHALAPISLLGVLGDRLPLKLFPFPRHFTVATGDGMRVNVGRHARRRVTQAFRYGCESFILSKQV